MAENVYVSFFVRVFGKPLDRTKRLAIRNKRSAGKRAEHGPFLSWES